MSTSVTAATIAGSPMLQLHLEPDAPLEVAELTASLAALARRYQAFVEEDNILGKGSDARLLVWSVAPGSIDIAFLPDLQAAAGMFASLYDPLAFITKFGKTLKEFIDLFLTKKDAADEKATLKDCNDAIAIAAPIANHGGTQTVTIIHGDVVFPVLTMPAASAQKIVTQAQARKTLAQPIDSELRQRVALVWSQMDRDKPKSDGRTPDKAKIEDIDPKPKPVFFTDEMGFLKGQMISDEENPYQMVYFVDVEVSHANGKVASYRVVGYHGKDDLN